MKEGVEFNESNVISDLDFFMGFEEIYENWEFCGGWSGISVSLFDLPIYVVFENFGIDRMWNGIWGIDPYKNESASISDGAL